MSPFRLEVAMHMCAQAIHPIRCRVDVRNQSRQYREFISNAVMGVGHDR